jgi:dolichol-phosphate mannosyltransferase
LKLYEADNKNYSHAAVILPTYCEAENIEKLVCSIEDLNLDLRIVVVDDSSPDKTADVIKRLAQKCKNVTLLSRPSKLGLGTAIRDGFWHIMSFEKQPEYIITMDADFSHNPKDIPRLLQYAQSGYDLVIGSRYCRGGKTKGWTLNRQIISNVANKITKALIRLPVNDFTSGFRCYSKRYVQKVLPSLHSQTYEIQIETLRQARIHNAKVAEAPITFENRKKGKSKLTGNEILGFFLYILKTLLK